MNAHQGYSVCQSHIGDLVLLQPVEGFKSFFAFFSIKLKPFFGLHRAAGTVFYFYIVSVTKVIGLGRLP